jgi:aspartate aminotransferase-like enzyme
MQGAFSDRWHAVAEANGKATGTLQVEWGRAITPEMVERELARGDYDAVAVVHNETSTGVINRLSEIAAVVHRHPEVIFLVDAVSSLGGAALDVDALEIDVCLAGLQKALALPPGLAVASVSQRALDRAATVRHRGYYFDFLEMLRHDEKSQTPTTPAIPQIQALDAQLESILAEGPERRLERHALLAGIVQDWSRRNFALFAEAGHESPTVTCVRNSRGISVAGLNDELARHGLVISNGYGKLKEQTFRIAHMGDTQEAELRELLEIIDRVLGL